MSNPWTEIIEDLDTLRARAVVLMVSGQTSDVATYRADVGRTSLAAMQRLSAMLEDCEV